MMIWGFAILAGLYCLLKARQNAPLGVLIGLVLLCSLPVAGGPLELVFTLFRAVVVPLLILRNATRPGFSFRSPLIKRLVLFLCLLCLAVGVGLAPDPLAAFKGVAYIVGLVATGIAMSRLPLENLRLRHLVALLLLSVGSAVVFQFAVETYEPGRLGGFGGAQALAQFAVAIYLLGRYSESRPSMFIFALSLIVVISTGSRTGLALMIILAAVYLLRRMVSGELLPLVGILAMFVPVSAVVAPSVIDGRSFQVLVVATESGDIGSLGTAAWRLGVVDEALEDISQRDALGLMLGSGLGSGVQALENDPSRLLGIEDENRVLHNEFLRAVYEAGLAGFALIVVVMLGIIWRSAGVAPRVLRGEIFIVLLVLGAVQNVLSSVGTIAGVAVGVMVGVALRPRYQFQSFEETKKSGLMDIRI